jgi:hypothetical protein
LKVGTARKLTDYLVEVGCASPLPANGERTLYLYPTRTHGLKSAVEATDSSRLSSEKYDERNERFLRLPYWDAAY